MVWDIEKSRVSWVGGGPIFHKNSDGVNTGRNSQLELITNKIENTLPNHAAREKVYDSLLVCETHRTNTRARITPFL